MNEPGDERARKHLTSAVAEFVALLRRDHEFALGPGEAHDALRAIEIAGITSLPRVRTALRLVCTASHDEIPAFERAFESFFLEPPRGVPNPAYAPRHTRPGAPPNAREDERDQPARRPRSPDPASDDASAAAGAREAAAVETNDALAWQAMRARYSPDAARAAPPRIAREGFEAMLAAADKLRLGLRIGRTRRWKNDPHGRRLDVRRTLRASLQTGGEPVVLRRLGHPHRNPHFVLLVDGSRSMAGDAGPVLQFATALARRSRRVQTYVFSTELRDVTARLRAYRFGERLEGLGEAWGGGTRIGPSVAALARSRRGRPIGDDTVVIVFSDGLDAADVPQLERAMRDLQRRAAAVVWLNPHAATPGFAPTARGMRAALPYLTFLGSANDAAAFERLARTLPRLCGSRLTRRRSS